MFVRKSGKRWYNYRRDRDELEDDGGGGGDRLDVRREDDDRDDDS